MARKTGIKIIKNTLNSGLKKYFKLTDPGGKVDMKAKERLGWRLINNILNGSPNESVVPPILTGRLRASGSVFIGDKFVGDTQGYQVVTRIKGSKGATPNKSHSDKISTVTVGFNTKYAAILHEKQFSENPRPGFWSPGKSSKESGDVGNKFLEKHLKADKEELLEIYADTVEEETTKESPPVI